MPEVLRYSCTAMLALLAIGSAAFGQDKMPWQPNLETAQRVAAQTNRLVLIHFWAPWCRPCVRLEREVFSNPETARGLEANFVVVKLNADESLGTARLYGVSSLPTDVIVTPTGKMVSQIPSPPTTAQYVSQLNQAAAGHRSLAERPASQSAQQSVPPASPGAAPPMGSGASYGPPSASPPAVAAQPPYNPPGYNPQANRPQASLQRAAGNNRYAEYFPEQQAQAPRYSPQFDNVTPAQAYTPAASAAQTPANRNSADPYAGSPPGAQSPAANPYAAPPAAQPSAVDPYAAVPSSAQPPAANPYAAAPQAGQPPAVDPYAAAPPAAQPSAVDPYAAAPSSAQPPAANPYAAAPPAAQPPAANPYSAAPPAARPSAADPYATAPPSAPPPIANPYVAAPQPPPNVPQLPPGCPPIGLDGNCPVTLAERKRWALGHPSFGVVHRGRTYLFLGPQEKEKFLADPDRYSPVLSGIDPVRALDNHVAVPGRREFGVFGADGRVYLFADEASRARFEANEQNYATRALQATQTQYQAMRPGR